jgi:uncharacterized protein YodC (DUF2158 family)
MINIKDKVRHVTSTLPMVVTEFETKTEYFSGPRSAFGPSFDASSRKNEKTPTGRIKCTWVDEKNNPNHAYFVEEELVKIVD